MPGAHDMVAAHVPGGMQCRNCKAYSTEIAFALGPVCPNAPAVTPSRGDIGDYQAAVGKWMVEVFGEEIAMDPLERIMRFLEEALELAQAEGMTAEEVGRVVSYVYGRDTGETCQEVGGVMVTLAAFCFRRGVDLKAAALTEFDRIDSPEMRLRIFDKQAFKRSQGLTSDGGFRGEGAA